jgi:hypothetical protein
VEKEEIAFLIIQRCRGEKLGPLGSEEGRLLWTIVVESFEAGGCNFSELVNCANPWCLGTDLLPV